MGSEGHQDIDLAILTALLKGKRVCGSRKCKSNLSGLTQQPVSLIVDIIRNDTITRPIVDNTGTSPVRHTPAIQFFYNGAVTE